MDLKITKEATPEQARQEWARWLESNEFQQGYNALTMAIHPFTDDEDQTVHITHCCLGVAAEMGCQLGILRRIEDTAYRYVGTEDDEMVDVRSGTLPKVMADFLGIGPMGDLLKSVVEYDNEGEIPLSAWLLLPTPSLASLALLAIGIRQPRRIGLSQGISPCSLLKATIPAPMTILPSCDSWPTHTEPMVTYCRKACGRR